MNFKEFAYHSLIAIDVTLLFTGVPKDIDFDSTKKEYLHRQLDQAVNELRYHPSQVIGYTRVNDMNVAITSRRICVSPNSAIYYLEEVKKSYQSPYFTEGADAVIGDIVKLQSIRPIGCVEDKTFSTQIDAIKDLTNRLP